MDRHPAAFPLCNPDHGHGCACPRLGCGADTVPDAPRVRFQPRNAIRSRVHYWAGRPGPTAVGTNGATHSPGRDHLRPWVPRANGRRSSIVGEPMEIPTLRSNRDPVARPGITFEEGPTHSPLPTGSRPRQRLRRLSKLLRFLPARSGTRDVATPTEHNQQAYEQARRIRPDRRGLVRAVFSRYHASGPGLPRPGKPATDCATNRGQRLAIDWRAARVGRNAGPHARAADGVRVGNRPDVAGRLGGQGRNAGDWDRHGKRVRRQLHVRRALQTALDHR